MPITHRVVVWDFDGVLNRNVPGGSMSWVPDLQRDMNVDPNAFARDAWSGRWDLMVTGQEDSRQFLLGVLQNQNAQVDVDVFMRYCFDRDARPYDEVLALLGRVNDAGVRSVIATNNDPYRSKYIWETMGMEHRVDRLFASGHLGVMKPNEAFYQKVHAELGGVARGEVFFIDDQRKNVDAAARFGWQAHCFEGDVDGLRQALGLEEV